MKNGAWRVHLEEYWKEEQEVAMDVVWVAMYGDLSWVVCLLRKQKKYKGKKNIFLKKDENKNNYLNKI